MKPEDPLFVVFNPQSGQGRGARLVRPVLQALSRGGGTVEHGLTEAPGDEARLTEEALRRGLRKIVAVGGDGTWSNVGNAILKSGLPAALGLIPGGTGCDLAKSLGLPLDDIGACAEIIRQGATRTIDVGRVEERCFLNVAGFGFDIAVIEDSWKPRPLRGDLLYLYCALRQLRRFPGFSVDVALDGTARGRQELLMLVISNARVFGGGFRIAPQADLADGALDFVAFRNMPLRRRLALMVRLLRGTHAQAPEVTTGRVRSVRLTFDAPPVYETDGEWNRATSKELHVESVPSALRVMVPPGS